MCDGGVVWCCSQPAEERKLLDYPSWPWRKLASDWSGDLAQQRSLVRRGSYRFCPQNETLVLLDMLLKSFGHRLPR